MPRSKKPRADAQTLTCTATVCGGRVTASSLCGEVAVRHVDGQPMCAKHAPALGFCVGQRPCGGLDKHGRPCEKTAYYAVEGEPFCGTHCRGQMRQTVPKDKEAEKMRAEAEVAHMASVERARLENLAAGRCGQLRVAKEQRYVKPRFDGFLSVFPNARASPKSHGYPSLSPKKLGPVEHGQPGLPTAQTIEGFHQFNKVFFFEHKNGVIRPEWYERRLEGYLTDDPPRHKYGHTKEEHLAALRSKGVRWAKDQNINIPDYVVFTDADGNEQRVSYMDARYFYCYFYELLAPQQEDFAKLVELLRQGYNLCICGGDGYSITTNPDDPQPQGKELEALMHRLFMDTSRPFGHELVLLCLLLLKHHQCPWNKHPPAFRIALPPLPSRDSSHLASDS